ncbi:MAG: hypothetical protein KF904_17360 [Rhodoblastus sp.]|nr:hypothetical protein [Rhodoblastus sp.]
MNRRTMIVGAAVIAAGVLACGAPALASRPVPRTITGCVSGGVFTSDQGYVIRARGPGFAEYDLSRFEGRRIVVRGMLSPGDLFAVKSRPRDLGPCRRPR